VLHDQAEQIRLSSVQVLLMLRRIPLANESGHVQYRQAKLCARFDPLQVLCEVVQAAMQ
jgi:hypothetical protein